MSTTSPNYFTCTLGQAQRLESTRPTQNLLDFLLEQSEDHGDLPAAGFYVPPTTSSSSTENLDDWDCRILSFRQIYRGLARVAESLNGFLSAINGGETTVAILHSSPGLFLFSWLALIATGHLVLVLSPKWTAGVAAKLCQSCNVSLILADDEHTDLATQISKEARNLGFSLETLSIMPKTDRDLLDFVEDAEEPVAGALKSNIQMDDLVYIQASAGVSTAIPKLVPQTHGRTIGVLPRLDGSGKATFLATPLYHGGLADVLRSWTSDALTWLFPFQDVPITTRNIAACLNRATEASKGGPQHNTSMPPVKYFASPPDLLPLLAEDASLVKHLKDMEIVGFGGSSARVEVGNKLVQEGVPLVSRFTSVEYGFLMSSHRDFANDKEWQYLRLCDGDDRHLQFERQPQTGSTSELIVGKDWPHLATTHNRDGGSHATYDLFEQHESLANAWRFHSPAGNPYTLMRDLVAKYGSDFSRFPQGDSHAISAPSENTGETIVLTGATSFLGAHLLSALLTEPDIHSIFVLIDEAATNDANNGTTATTQIIQNSFSSHLLPLPANFSRVVKAVPFTLSASQLGLDDTTYMAMLSTVTTIMHLAWDDSVGTSPSVSAGSTDLIGLHSLLTLAVNSSLATAPRFVFCSSTQAASRHPPPIPESADIHPSAASPTGLGRSKWVAEQILVNASTAKNARLEGRITVIRTGQLSASSQTSVWSIRDPCVLMLSTAMKNVLGCLPDLDQARRVQGREEGEQLNWLPVDVAARAFIEASLRRGGGKQGRPYHANGHAGIESDLIDVSGGVTTVERGARTGVKVLHLLAPPRKHPKKWASLLIPLKMAAGVKIVSFDNWIGLLRWMRREGAHAHPSLKLINYWKHEYTNGPPSEDDADHDHDTGDEEEVSGTRIKPVSRVTTIDMTSPISTSSFYDWDDGGETAQLTAGFEVVESLQAMPSLQHVKDVDIQQVNKAWKWIKDHV